MAEYARRVAPFLRELGELSTKHRMHIGGCGCCDSPWISVTKDDELPTTYAIKDGHLEAE